MAMHNTGDAPCHMLRLTGYFNCPTPRMILYLKSNILNGVRTFASPKIVRATDSLNLTAVYFGGIHPRLGPFVPLFLTLATACLPVVHRTNTIDPVRHRIVDPQAEGGRNQDVSAGRGRQACRH